jgi:hypothetical protein
MKELIVQGKPLVLGNFGGILDDKGSLIGAPRWIAQQAGIELPARAKGVVTPSMKEIRAMIVAEGEHDEKQVTEWNKSYNAQRTDFFSKCGLVNGQLAADPTLRKSVKINRNTKGEVIGATTTYRKERSASQSMATQLAELQRQLAAANAVLAAGGLQLPA